MLTTALNSVSCQSIDDVHLDVRDEVETYEDPEIKENDASQRGRDAYALFLNIIRLPVFVMIGIGTVLAKIYGG
jgi:hypothetical protein